MKRRGPLSRHGPQAESRVSRRDLPSACAVSFSATSVMNSDFVASRSRRPARADLPEPCGSPVPRVRDRNPRRGVRQDRTCPVKLGFQRRIVHRRAFISRDEQVHACVLMPNHLPVPSTADRFSSGGRDAPVPLCGIAGMKWFLGTYTSRFNRRPSA
jgi:hypothetical protein